MPDTSRDRSISVREEFDRWKVDYAAHRPGLKPWLDATKSAAVSAAVSSAVLFVVFLVFFLQRQLRGARAPGARPLEDLVRSALRETQQDLGRTLELSRPGGRPEAGAETLPLPVSLPTAEPKARETEPFLRHLEEHVQARLDELNQTKRTGQAQERFVFVVLMVAGLLTLGLSLGGIACVVVGRLTPGVLAECVAILPGGGTLILWQKSRTLREQRGSIARELDSHVRTLQAIQLVRGVPDPAKRSQGMIDLAQKLLEETKTTPRSA